jgi:hypothetical protein
MRGAVISVQRFGCLFQCQSHSDFFLPSLQAAEKASSASLHLIASLQRTELSTPPLVDRSRASHLKPF